MQYPGGPNFHVLPSSSKRVQYFEESLQAPSVPYGFHSNEDVTSTYVIQKLIQQVEELTERLNRITKYLHVDEAEDPTVIISGANLQIVKHQNAKEPERNTRGLGNLIIGYNLPRSRSTPADRTGSHNIIIGDQHSYTGSNSIVFGRKNQAFGNSCIIGGFKNFTHAEYSTVLSGCYNKAYAWNSIILGGWGKQRKQQQLCVEKTLL